jgi:lipoprotein-releasing system ATP-binding protein
MNNHHENYVLEAEHLSKIYTEAGQSIHVLEDLNLSVITGETVAIVGASGSGKTTLLQLLGGLDKPSHGRVKINGQCLANLSETAKGMLRNRDLGFVYQFHHLLPEFNALENVCIPLLIRGVSPRMAEEKARYYIDQVELSARLTHRVGELSGGERQRIALARALVTEPRCVLADEPTGNLDEHTAAHVTDLLLALNQRLKTSFVIVTHNRVMAERMQRILLLRNGQLNSARG